MKVGPQAAKWIAKKAKAGFRGYPVGTVAFYGPDNRRASKVVVGVLDRPDADPADLRKWFEDGVDVRAIPLINEEIVAFLREHGVRTVSMAEGIIGCPHEEGIDYPDGGTCPQCPFWANRDRWGGASG
jgi:hypothetical protein